MADANSAHLSRAQQNESRADAYEAAFPTDPDWAIVFRFYSAVHFIEGYLESKGISVASHQERREAIKTTPGLSGQRHISVRKAYFALSNLGWQVRYDPGYVAVSTTVVEAAASLTVVRQHITARLKKAAKPKKASKPKASKP